MESEDMEYPTTIEDLKIWFLNRGVWK